MPITEAKYDELLAGVRANHMVEYNGRSAVNEDQVAFIAKAEGGVGDAVALAPSVPTSEYEAMIAAKTVAETRVASLQEQLKAEVAEYEADVQAVVGERDEARQAAERLQVEVDSLRAQLAEAEAHISELTAPVTSPVAAPATESTEPAPAVVPEPIPEAAQK